MAMTWVNGDAPLYPLTCALFNQVSLTFKSQFVNSLRKTSTVTTPCEECVSGPPNCSCSIQGDCKRNLHDHSPITVEGECDVMEDNLVDIVGNVESWELCNALCSENSDCNVFTYLGEENHFRSDL